jgi:hypothetical protein
MALGCHPSQVRGPEAAKAPASPAEVDRIVASLNANAAKIRSLQCLAVDIDGKSQRQPYTLSAKLAYQAPQDFRLTGYAVSHTEVDLGSNEEEIWFWIARAEPPAVNFCRRVDLPYARLNTPFQPDWLIEVLGVTTIDPATYRLGESTSEYITLIADRRSPDGRVVTKRLVVDPKTLRVMAYEIWGADRRDRPLVSAYIREYHVDPETSAFVPRIIELDWPDAETRLTMTMRARKIQLNVITPEMASRLFRRGQYSNADEVNLALVGRPGPSQSLRQPSPSGPIDGQVRPAGVRFTGEVRPGGQDVPPGDDQSR